MMNNAERNGYNEVVLDKADWEMSLPMSISAFFYNSRRDGRRQALAIYERFMRQYTDWSWDCAFLAFDPDNHVAPFSEDRAANR